MRNLAGCFVVGAAIGLFLTSPVFGAQEQSTTSPAMEEEAMSPLNRMAEFLSKAKQFTVTVDSGYDVVQESGQKIEFGETRKITLRRPDRARVETERRDGKQNLFVFDGQNIAIYSDGDNAYSTAVHPGSVDDAVDFFTNDLDMRLPLADLYSGRLPEILKESVDAAHYVQQDTISGVPCDHIALRNETVDFQIWIAREKDPVPRRIVITYKLEEGQPQYWAQFSDWNFSPKVSDSLFTFTPPKEAERIPFLAQVRSGLEGGEKGDPK